MFNLNTRERDANWKFDKTNIIWKRLTGIFGMNMKFCRFQTDTIWFADGTQIVSSQDNRHRIGSILTLKSIIVIIFNIALTKSIYPSTQWAAVKIQFWLIREPPHSRSLPFLTIVRCAIQGNSPGVASVPLTILVSLV